MSQRIFTPAEKFESDTRLIVDIQLDKSKLSKGAYFVVEIQQGNAKGPVFEFHASFNEKTSNEKTSSHTFSRRDRDTFDELMTAIEANPALGDLIEEMFLRHRELQNERSTKKDHKNS